MQPIVRTLPRRQEIFVRQYMANGYKRIEAAMVACPTNSRATAGQLARTWLADNQVQRAVRQLMDQQAVRLDITSDNVMQELAQLANSNIQELYDDFGSILPIHRMPRRVAACIKEIEEKESVNSDGIVTVTRKYKLYDRLTALDKMARVLNMFSDQADPGEESGRLNVNLQVNFVDAADGRRVVEVTDGTGLAIEQRGEPVEGQK